MRRLILVTFALVLGAVQAHASVPNTLRVDIQHGGDAKTEH